MEENRFGEMAINVLGSNLGKIFMHATCSSLFLGKIEKKKKEQKLIISHEMNNESIRFFFFCFQLHILHFPTNFMQTKTF